MRMPAAIFFSACVLSMAMAFASFNTAQSQQRSGAAFMVSASNGSFVWRVNTMTGAVSYCARSDNSNAPSAMSSRPPYCSAQSAPAPTE